MRDRTILETRAGLQQRKLRQNAGSHALAAHAPDDWYQNTALNWLLPIVWMDDVNTFDDSLR
jgi:hypothetical protein